MSETAKEYKRRLEALRAHVDDVTGLAPRQVEATRLLGGDATHVLLYGGARSMKTFVIVRAIVARALKAEDSRHLIARFRFNHCKQYIGMDTLPAVLRTCFPDVPCKPDKQDWFFRFPNNSEIWLGGLDEKERTEKILGAEYATIFLNEISQISWAARNMVITRLAQRRADFEGDDLALRAYYDCNPPPQSHWAFKLFMQNRDPETGQSRTDKANFAQMMLHPKDNPFIHEDFIAELEAMPERQRRRFLEGEWLPATENALWNPAQFDEYRIGGEGQSVSVPDMQRIVVAVDPSGADEDEEKNNDEIGIICAGLGVDGHCYVLDDASKKTSPREWAKIATNIYHARGADLVVGEVNYGGAMVREVVQTADSSVPFKEVNATRAKHVRAEPVAALYDQGKVHHVGLFPKLEDELSGFTTAGYIGAKSPNRADACIWAISELFPGMVRKPKRDLVIEGSGGFDVHAW